MKKDKNNQGIIAFLIVVIVGLLLLVVLISMGIINFKNKSNNNVSNNTNNVVDDNSNNIQNNENDSNQDINISSTEKTDNWVIEDEARKYITLEDVALSSDASTKKVKFNNLDDSVTSKFYIDQQDLIDSIHIYNDEYIKGGAEYKVKAFVNNNILSVVYLLEEINAIGTCGSKMAVTNIDLVNNKVITEEELLNKVNISYNKLINYYYNFELESWKKLNESVKHDVDYYEVTFDDFSTNKDKYIKIGLEKLPNVIYTYIHNGKVKYDYYSIHIGTLFHQVGKGGCFNWETITLGDYE